MREHRTASGIRIGCSVVDEAFNGSELEQDVLLNVAWEIDGPAGRLLRVPPHPVGHHEVGNEVWRR